MYSSKVHLHVLVFKMPNPRPSKLAQKKLCEFWHFKNQGSRTSNLYDTFSKHSNEGLVSPGF